MKLIFEEVDHIATNLKATRISLEAELDLLNSGIVELEYFYSIDISNKAILVYSERSKQPIGILAYYQMPSDSVWIRMSYVKPKYRRKGVWTQMRDYLANVVYEKGCRHIYSGVLTKNSASMQGNSKRGKQVVVTFKESL